MKLMQMYIQDMKVNHPEEYKKLVDGYSSENELLTHVEQLTKKAMVSAILKENNNGSNL